MDSLPQEILDNILGRIPARESNNYNEKLLELENWISGPSDIVENMAHCDIAHTEILRELMLILSEWPDDTRSPTLARHGKLIILPNKYGPFQQLPQMSKDGESDPLFVGLRRAIDGFSEFEYGSHLSSSFFWSPPPSLGDAVPYWQNMTKLKVDCDHGFAQRRVCQAQSEKEMLRSRQYSVSGDDNVAAWTVNEKVMVPMLTSIAKAAGQMISLKELWFKVILAKYDTYQGSEWFHRFHVDYLAPGVMPDVDDERFPRCKCYSKDWIPEFRALQAGDLEKARLLLRIKTENQKREGTKNSCPDSPRWPLNMDQWQPNEELLDLLRQAGRKAHSKDAVIVRHVHHHRQDYIME
ncbi:hypothetical protein CTAM01_11530 [Colletotrichum tamarilloi]|uniref:Uncharacterized protein n=1 Tax=Colletotrichum tamarilloi TaxID=1209934 RepID=A0ABQ9QXF5_9PEZI|nr:uncharacterized protein CTAM01_11530 [Colletotrichum tamarilloi]KAK1488158.1 hypothetical protein CTAM01_11530 [Colletotrichum tamarilloi]